MLKNFIFGSSGLVGNEFYKINKNKKNYFFFSYQNPNFKKLDLNKKINLKTYNNELVNIFFFSSPRFLIKNNKAKILLKEYKWLKKVIKYFKINKIIYLSSPSIYYKKSIIGKVKKKCERLIFLKKKNFKFYQIWRPYNLVGKNEYLSDHFHNLAIKKFFIEKRNNYNFYGSSKDKRGYSSVSKFVKLLHKHSNYNKSFIKNYGNKDLITTFDLVNIYKKIYLEKFNREFAAKFQSKVANVSVVNNKTNSIFSNENSKKVIKNYIKRILNEKKM